MATGLYDPAYEHDACGVGMVADLHGRPDHDIVDRGLTVLERLAHRGASGAEVETGDGAGILVQSPAPLLVRGRPRCRVLPSRGRRVRRGPRLPAHRRGRRARRPGASWSRRRPRRGSRCWAGAPCPLSRTAWATPHGVPCRRSSSSSWRQPDPVSTPWRWSAAPSCCASEPSTRSTACTSPRCRPARSSTRACSPPSSCASSSPTCATPPSSPAWPSCTRASRPTPSRAGRWPTRTATCATTGRSTRWRETATGCVLARHCSRPP